ncbi:DUF1772 domain-containing protein [Blastococcus sp. TML/M2B]|uniref:anthrone oxygenase family protein n=1 Tax=unclassified Blastococcus TaxID=2619396 RepID=UPI00190D5135|nr:MULTISPECIES: anthrone oxygenase family protein [unclassified Blastococcus]MBN1092703.1 DUF1772 domain-containing protein [Blastococcus sp. TML/M2B]MBN1097186.1 DUF1772 domain-containing protein [Blastococcus sp. TML/C7B]
MPTSLQVLTGVAALGCGLVGGVFFAFSTFVLQGLARLPAAGGVAAMQSINRTAVRPGLMTALFGTAAICLAAGVGAVTAWGEEGAPWVVAGSALYLLGGVAVTAAANVPLNDALAAADPEAEGTADRWRGYVRAWARWNHLRTVTCLAACAAHLMALAG